MRKPEDDSRFPSSLFNKRVTHISQPVLQKQPAGAEEEEEESLQTKREGSSSESPTTTPLVHEILCSPGQPLDAVTREFMESRFDHDFGRVRVHTGPQAAASASAVQARAYTVGSSVVFGADQYRPETESGRSLLAHELTHVAQQGAAGPLGGRAPSPPLMRMEDDHTAVKPGASSLRLVLPDGSERRIAPRVLDQPGPPSAGGISAGAEQDSEGQDTTATESEVQPIEEPRVWIQRMAGTPVSSQVLQRTATFTNPTPRAQNPLTRLANNDSPGLTTPTINGNLIPDAQAVMTEISPTRVVETVAAGGQVDCRVDPAFAINTSANVIIASNPGANGWTGSVTAASIGNPPACTGGGAPNPIPATMVARPANADFVNRVRASEQEHVDDLRVFHDRHLAPYDRFVTALRASGADLNACGQNLVTQLGNRPFQAAFGLVLGMAASTQKLDGPNGTHEDTASVTIGNNCASVQLTVSQARAPIRGAEPGNVVRINPTVTTFNPQQLSVSGTNIVEGTGGAQRVIKSFSSAQNAQKGLQVFQHYRMTSRLVIGPFEFFRSGSNPPTGALPNAITGVAEQSIDPNLYQVTFGVPDATDWAITQVIGNNIEILLNFGSQRDEAYSAAHCMRNFNFTTMGRIGRPPEMRYYRT
ncbi:MAG TPA: DUF4157 domain-containing protein [Verrucomicrobiales bacterium]|nr:DUF4157 domain-containing protein [Verrucomicrobiales bacterium]